MLLIIIIIIITSITSIITIIIIISSSSNNKWLSIDMGQNHMSLKLPWVTEVLYDTVWAGQVQR